MIDDKSYNFEYKNTIIPLKDAGSDSDNKIVTEFNSLIAELNLKYSFAKLFHLSETDWENYPISLHYKDSSLTLKDFVKENLEISKELKNYQHYTNFAKAAKENLTKKDFSMLETMSRKVEETTNLNENLKHIVTELDQQKRELTAKVDQLEKINLYLMKMSGEVPGELVIDEEDENYKEILKYQSNPKILINTIFKIKQENIQLSQNIQDITIECNQRLRDALKQAELKHQQNINGMVNNSQNIFTSNNNK